MGETDIAFRRLLRALPRPILQPAFLGHQIESLGPLDPSVDRSRQLTTDNLFRVRDHTVEAVVHVEVEREWCPELPRCLFEYASAAVMATPNIRARIEQEPDATRLESWLEAAVITRSFGDVFRDG